MNIFKQTMSYLFQFGKGKRFFLLFLLLLVPCAVAAYYFPMSNYIAYFFDYKPNKYASFGELWLGSFNHSTAALIGIACAFILFVVCIAYATGVVTRHVRVGEFTFPKILYSVNENFFPSFAASIFFFATVFVSHTLYTLFQFMWLRIPGSALGLTLTIITFILIIFLLAFILSATATWLPIMSFTGLYVFKAFALAFSRSKFHKNAFLTVLLSILITFAVSVGEYFLRNIWYAQWILQTVAYTSIAVISLVYNILLYCEAESIQREDLAVRYFGR